MTETSEAPLVDEPSLLPTRKLTAMIFSGLILAALQTWLSWYWPDNPLEQLAPDIDIWLQGGIMIIFGYATRNRENVDTSKSTTTSKQVGAAGTCTCNNPDLPS